jgi:hypothetical protein
MELYLHFPYFIRYSVRRVYPTQTVKNKQEESKTTKWKYGMPKMGARRATYHIDEILESDGGGGALLRPFQQDVSLVDVDFGDELRFVQNLQEVIPRDLTKSLRVILPSKK